MITGITFENFMAFSEKQVIPIRPITLVFGPNSSGKSSIFRALAALKHVSETHGDAEPDLVDAQWSSMRLGGWQNLVRHHLGSGEIKLGLKTPWVPINFSCRAEDRERIEDPGSWLTWGFDKSSEEVERVWILGRGEQVGPAEITGFEQVVDNDPPVKLQRKGGQWMTVEEWDGLSKLRDRFAWQLAVLTSEEKMKSADYGEVLRQASSNFRKLIEGFTTEIRPLFLDDHNVKPLLDLYDLLWALKNGRSWLPDSFWDFDLKFESWHKVARLGEDRLDFISLIRDAGNQPEFLGDLWHIWCHHLALVNLKCPELADWIHLDPIRQRPDYPLTFGSIPSSAEATPWKLMLQKEEIRERASSMLSEITEGEYRIGVRYRSSKVSRADDFSATELQREERELCFVHKDGSSHSPFDLGYGISTLLPIIAAVSSEKGKLISIEQPELHLHPAMQAKLGDLFIESAMRKWDPYDEDGQPNRFLVETHSEHLVLRILRRIRETTEESMDEWPDDLKYACPDGISPDDVAVLYVEPGEDGATVKELRIDDYGEFRDKWPGGFFEERANEIF
jgi:predicted ATPase